MPELKNGETQEIMYFKLNLISIFSIITNGFEKNGD